MTPLPQEMIPAVDGETVRWLGLVLSPDEARALKDLARLVEAAAHRAAMATARRLNDEAWAQRVAEVAPAWHSHEGYVVLEPDGRATVRTRDGSRYGSGTAQLARQAAEALGLTLWRRSSTGLHHEPHCGFVNGGDFVMLAEEPEKRARCCRRPA